MAARYRVAVDTELRELERAASGDGLARQRFFAAAARGSDPGLASIVKIQDRVYMAAMLALAVAERGGLDVESSRFGQDVIQSTFAITEDDCVRALARCVRALTGAASWALLLLKGQKCEGASLTLAGILAGKSADGHVALAIRSQSVRELSFTSGINSHGEPTGFPYKLDDDLAAFSATLESLSVVFRIQVLPSREALNEARRAMRRVRGGPLIRPRVPRPVDAIATWAEYAPERLGCTAWIDDPGTISPTYANGTRPIVIAPEDDARRWAALW